MPAPRVELRGQPFTMKPEMEVNGPGNTLYPSVNDFLVTAPGFEDWNIVIMRKPTGFRAYVRDVVESYSLAFGRGGHCLHYRHHALRDSKDGLPLRPTFTAEAMLARIQRLFLESEPIPV